MSKKVNGFDFGILTNGFAILGPMLFGSVYLYCLGYTESLGVAEYPSISQSTSFFVNSLVYRLAESDKLISNVLCGTFAFSIILLVFPKLFMERVKAKLPLARREFFQKQRNEILSGKFNLRNRLRLYRKIKELEDKETGEYRKYLFRTIRIFMLITPFSICILYVFRAELLVFIPIIVTTIILYLANLIIRSGNRWDKTAVDYLLTSAVIVIGLSAWKHPFDAGKIKGKQTLTTFPDKFPGQYIGNTVYGNLLWIGDKARYFVICKNKQPGVYEVYEDKTVFVYSGDYIMRDNFCR